MSNVAYNATLTVNGRAFLMCISDKVLFEKLCDEFESNLKESKAYISSDVIHEIRSYANEYSIEVFTSAPYSDESIGDQGIRSNALADANVHGDFDSLLRNAVISEQLGKYSFEHYDDIDKSISHLFDALFLQGLWFGSKIQSRYMIEVGEVEIKKRTKEKEDGRLGGKERAKVFLPIKVELTRLLFEKVPSEGWKSISDAIKVIETELFEFIESESRKGQGGNKGGDADNKYLLWDNLDGTITRWIREDDFIRAAFDSVVIT